MDKQQVIGKLNEQLKYVNEVDKLKEFWATNNTILEKIIVHYFSFSNSNQYNIMIAKLMRLFTLIQNK